MRPCLRRFQSNSAMRSASEHFFSPKMWPCSLASGDSSQIWPCGLLQNILSQSNVTMWPCLRRFQSNSAMRLCFRAFFLSQMRLCGPTSGDFSQIRLCGLLQNILSQYHVAFPPCLRRFQFNLAMRPALKHSFSVTCGHSALRLEIPVKSGHASCFETLFLSHMGPFDPAFGRFQSNLAMRSTSEHFFSVPCGLFALSLGDSSQIWSCGLL